MVRASAALPVLLLILLLGSAVAGPIASLRDGAVIVQLPPGWQRVDQEDLDLVTMWGAEVTGGRIGEAWEAGFTPGGRDLLLGPPFVLAQMDENGRVSYGEVSRLPDVESIRSRIEGSGNDDVGRRQLRLDSMRFDRDRFALETVSWLPRSPWGELEIRTITYLTETGSLTLHGYLGPSAEDEARRAVDSILGGVTIADRLVYRPTLRDRWSDLSRRPAFWYLMAIGAALATAFVVRTSRRRQRS